MNSAHRRPAALLMPTYRALRVLLVITLIAVVLALAMGRADDAPPIRIGAVHALTGVMSASERGLVDAIRLAVEEINAAGGLLGRQVELLVADSASDWSLAAREGERLLSEDGVSALFACWTSACRRALKPRAERLGGLMFYPLQYEGLEQSPNIVYMGSAPNQQIIPGARWALEHLGDRLYLIGSDYIFPRTANQLIRDLVGSIDGEILAERYAAIDATDFQAIAAEIASLKPDAVLNTLNGESNRDFFRALAEAGLDAMPVVSFSVAEPELTTTLRDHAHADHFAVWGYFQSLPTEASRRFVEAFKTRFGQDRVVSDPLVSSYEAVMLWAAAVRDARTDDPTRVRLTANRVSVPGPSGIVTIDAATGHRWRRVYIGRARADGQFDAAEISEAPVRPVPFPLQRSRAAWLALVAQLAAAEDDGHPARPEDSL